MATPKRLLSVKKRPSAAFKSPLQRKETDTSTTASQKPESLQSEVEEMKLKIQKLDDEIDSLQKEGYKAEDLQKYIDKLHQYNEVKDIGQMVLGRIAVLEGVRTKDLYGQYGLNLDD